MELVGKNKNTNARSTTEGMTLVEVMVAMFVLIAVFGGVLSCAIRAFAQVNQATIISRETAILNDKIEEMRAMQFTALLASLSPGLRANDENEGENERSNRPSLTKKLLNGHNNFQCTSTLLSSSATSVTVKVTVQPTNNPSLSLSATTMISKRGLIVKPAA